MKEEELEKFIIENIKIRVKKTSELKGNDNQRQYKERPDEQNISLFPVRLEGFSVVIAIKLPEKMDAGCSGFDITVN
jgi:hypothetical protein